jgi:hypothetical protein
MVTVHVPFPVPRSAMNVVLKRIRQRRSPQSFPDTAEDLAKSDLFTGW